MTQAVDYRRPRTVAEALELKASLPESRFIAGGTDLMVGVQSGRLRPRALVSLCGVAELRGVAANGTTSIGALSVLSDLAADGAVARRHPLLVQAIGTMGSVQIRNVGTLGGNLANASPCADTAPPLLVSEARMRIVGPGGERTVAADAFFLGPGRTVLGAGEILGAVEIDPAPDVRGLFLKCTRVKMDLGLASVAVALRIDGGGTLRDVRVAAGAVAPVPLRLRAAEQLLEGKRPSPELGRAAGELARDEVSPITDLRASADYRRHIVSVYVARALQALVREGA